VSNSYYQENFNPLSNLDSVWSGGLAGDNKDKRFSNYYDYYFGGEDIKVYVDGLFEPENELDISSFSYSIKQEKQPLYGFWSYNYDTVLYGTRIVSGEFTIYTRYPRRMTDLIEQAASVRVKNPTPQESMGGVVSSLRSKLESADDQKNIEKYWAYSQLDRITADPLSKIAKDSGHNIFSAHPPFNFVILYGAQEASMSPLDYSGTTGGVITDNLDRMIVSDINERLIRTDNNANPMKIVLQEVQLLGMATSYSTGGQPVAESYQFIARDLYFSEVNLGFIKSGTTQNTSDTNQGRNGQSTTDQSSNNLN
jgi:hypothetical protein